MVVVTGKKCLQRFVDFSLSNDGTHGHTTVFLELALPVKNISTLVQAIGIQHCAWTYLDILHVYLRFLFNVHLSKRTWSERACDQRSNLGRPLFLAN